jgi:hypothetical protein
MHLHNSNAHVINHQVHINTQNKFRMSVTLAPADPYFMPDSLSLVETTPRTSASTTRVESAGSSRSNASRPSVSVQEILDSGSLSKQPLQGKRHPWNMLVGTVSPEILKWLRADIFFQAAPVGKERRLAFEGFTKRSKTEEGRKLIIAGRMGKCGSSSMCGLSVQEPLPAIRVVAWHQAFLACNLDALTSMQGCARAMVSKLDPSKLGLNGEHFMTTPLAEWFVTCGELVFTKGGNKTDGYWQEPKHQDGGMSVMHLGLTLAGNRTLRCWQTDDLPDIVLQSGPGTVYLGQLTGCEHQVTHELSEPWELLEVTDLGLCSCTIMCRTALFPHCRARGRNTTPNPQEVFFALARAFASSLRNHQFRLPSFEACKQKESELSEAQSDSARPRKKSKMSV